jgi:hypothetical protein
MACGAHGEEWGTLTRRFVVDGTVPPPATFVQIAVPGIQIVDESVIVGLKGGLKNAVVYLRTKNAEIAPMYVAAANDEVTVEIKNLRFDHHLVLLRTSQTLKLVNSDGINHNPKLDPVLNPAWSPALAVNAVAKQKLSREEARPVEMGDKLHPWMKAWVLVRDSPYAAISVEDGRFAIRDLPVGAEMVFQVWHERAGALKNVAFKGGLTGNKGQFKLAIKPGENDLGDIVVPSKLLRR